MDPSINPSRANIPFGHKTINQHSSGEGNSGRSYAATASAASAAAAITIELTDNDDEYGDGVDEPVMFIQTKSNWKNHNLNQHQRQQQHLRPLPLPPPPPPIRKIKTAAATTTNSPPLLMDVSLFSRVPDLYPIAKPTTAAAASASSTMNGSIRNSYATILNGCVGGGLSDIRNGSGGSAADQKYRQHVNNGNHLSLKKSSFDLGYNLRASTNKFSLKKYNANFVS